MSRELTREEKRAIRKLVFSLCANYDRAGPRFRDRAFGGQRRLQHRIIGQNGIPEVAAVGSRPAFPQHITGAVQRYAPILPICGRPFLPDGRTRYCSAACSATALRKQKRDYMRKTRR